MAPLTHARRPRGFDVPLLPVEECLFRGDIVCIGKFLCDPQHPLFRNSGPATTWCIAFPRRSVWIRHRDDEAFVADPTVATLYNRGDEYERQIVDERGDFCDWFAVAPDVLLEIALRHGCATDDPDRPFGIHRAACDSRTYVLQRTVIEHVRRSTAPDVMRVEEQALTIIDRLLATKRTRRADKTRAGREVAEAVRAVVGRRFGESLSIRELARAVGVSPFHLCHTFRRVTGTTITRFRDQLRVRASLELLDGYRGRFTGLALELGYSSHSHFTMSFRRTFQLTPSELMRHFTDSGPAVG